MSNEYLDLAVSAAKAAGEYLRLRTDIHVEADEAHDIKLSTDRDSERIILETLAPSKLSVLAEESGEVGGNSKLRWIIDPLDGTVNYFKGADDLSCVSIALFDGDDPVLGVVNRFAVNELFVGVVGQGAFLNGEPIYASCVAKLSDAILATGFSNIHKHTEDSMSRFIEYTRQVKKVRMLGSAALMGTFVACGRFDIYYEEDIRLWDVAGAMAIVRSAGGAARLEQHPNDELFRCVFASAATEGLLEEFEHAKSV